jgi:PAS domain S-box-containing protein
MNDRWYHCIDKAIAWPDGRLVRYELAVDIHEQKVAEESLRASENRYRILTENVADGVTIYQDGKLVFANASFSSITGYAVEELIDMNPAKLFHVDYRKDYKELIHSYEKGTPDDCIQSVCIHKDGREIWTEADHNLIQWKGRPALLFTVRDITDRKLREIAMAEEREQLQKENIKLRESIKDRYRFGEIIGKSEGMQEVYELIMRSANSDANVVIHGESGTGKELIAQTIHKMSDLSDKAFVPVNCGAVPETLFESEFFGHKKGAFTGAHIDTHGFFDTACGGTLFLDEVGELTLTMQAKLLRAVEGGGYVPVGSSQVKKTDARIIAATNRDLSDMVQKGLFREDFFYRLHVIPISVPQLRNRKEDIPLLVDHFLRQMGNGEKRQAISGKVLEDLYNHNWPGNVRELQNLLHRYISLNRLDFITTQISHDNTDYVLSGDRFQQEGMGLRETLETFEREFLLKILEQNLWHRGKTAERLAIPERTLYRKLKQYQLN